MHGDSFGPPVQRAARVERYYLKCPNRLCSGVCTVATLRNAQGWGLSFERGNIGPAGTGLFNFCCLGRLRGGRQMGAC